MPLTFTQEDFIVYDEAIIELTKMRKIMVYNEEAFVSISLLITNIQKLALMRLTSKRVQSREIFDEVSI